MQNAKMAESAVVVLGGATATMLKGRGSLQVFSTTHVFMIFTTHVSFLLHTFDLYYTRFHDLHYTFLVLLHTLDLYYTRFHGLDYPSSLFTTHTHRARPTGFILWGGVHLRGECVLF